ncbi:hypothetical protein ACVIIV_003548 [Bradyrhizobium sp. USDA 4354]
MAITMMADAKPRHAITPSATVPASLAQAQNMAAYLTHLGRRRLGSARVEPDKRLGIELRQSSLRLAKFLLKTAGRRRSIVSDDGSSRKLVVLQHGSEHSCREK